MPHSNHIYIAGQCGATENCRHLQPSDHHHVLLPEVRHRREDCARHVQVPDGEAVKEAGGGEALEKAKVVEHLNMQLMTVDSSVEMKYMDILQEDDEEKRKELEDGVIM